MHDKDIRMITSKEVKSLNGVTQFITTASNKMTMYARSLFGSRSPYSVVCWVKLEGEHDYGLIMDNSMNDEPQKLFVITLMGDAEVEQIKGAVKMVSTPTGNGPSIRTQMAIEGNNEVFGKDTEEPPMSDADEEEQQLAIAAAMQKWPDLSKAVHGKPIAEVQMNEGTQLIPQGIEEKKWADVPSTDKKDEYGLIKASCAKFLSKAFDRGWLRCHEGEWVLVTLLTDIVRFTFNGPMETFVDFKRGEPVYVMVHSDKMGYTIKRVDDAIGIVYHKDYYNYLDSMSVVLYGTPSNAIPESGLMYNGYTVGMDAWNLLQKLIKALEMDAAVGASHSYSIALKTIFECFLPIKEPVTNVVLMSELERFKVFCHNEKLAFVIEGEGLTEGVVTIKKIADAN